MYHLSALAHFRVHHLYRFLARISFVNSSIWRSLPSRRSIIFARMFWMLAMPFIIHVSLIWKSFTFSFSFSACGYVAHSDVSIVSRECFVVSGILVALRHSSLFMFIQVHVDPQVYVSVRYVYRCSKTIYFKISELQRRKINVLSTNTQKRILIPRSTRSYVIFLGLGILIILSNEKF